MNSKTADRCPEGHYIMPSVLNDKFSISLNDKFSCQHVNNVSNDIHIIHIPGHKFVKYNK